MFNSLVHVLVIMPQSLSACGRQSQTTGVIRLFQHSINPSFHQFQEQLDEARQNKKKRIDQVQVRMRQPATVVAQLNTNRFLQNLILKLGRSSAFRFLSEDCEELDFLQHMLKREKDSGPHGPALGQSQQSPSLKS